MSESNDPSYYEIALTHRQVLIFFVLLLSCVLAAFASGVWVGRDEPGGAPRVEPAGAAAAEGGLAEMEEFQYPTPGSQEATEAGPPETSPQDAGSQESGPAAAGARQAGAQDQGDERKPDLSGLLSEPRADTTLAEDLGAAAGAAASPSGADRPPAEPDPPVVTVVGRDAEPAAASPPAAAVEGFVVQVFSTRDEPKAQRVVEQLVGGGYRAFLSPVQVGSQPMYRVRIGPFQERVQAERIKLEVKQKLDFEAWIPPAGS